MNNAEIHDLAAEVWAASQTAPGQCMEDAIDRVAEILTAMTNVTFSEDSVDAVVSAVRQALMDAAHAHCGERSVASGIIKAEVYATNAIRAALATTDGTAMSVNADCQRMNDAVVSAIGLLKALSNCDVTMASVAELEIVLSAINMSSEPPAPTIPEGWKLVPIKPTKAMKDAVNAIAGPVALAYGLAAWETMVVAAPDELCHD